MIFLNSMFLSVYSMGNKTEEKKEKKYENAIQYFLDTGKAFSYLKNLKKTGTIRITLDLQGSISGLKTDYSNSTNYGTFSNSTTSYTERDLSTSGFSVSLQYLFKILKGKYFKIYYGLGPSFRYSRETSSGERDTVYVPVEQGYNWDNVIVLKSYGVESSLIFETTISERVGLFGDYTFSYYILNGNSEQSFTYSSEDSVDTGKSIESLKGNNFSYGKFRFGVYVKF